MPKDDGPAFAPNSRWNAYHARYRDQLYELASALNALPDRHWMYQIEFARHLYVTTGKPMEQITIAELRDAFVHTETWWNGPVVRDQS